MDIVLRAKNILLKPKEEWAVISGETTTTADLYKGYIVPLAAIPAVASFLGMSFVGMPMVGRLGIGSGLAAMVMQFAMALIAVYVLALVIDNLAPTFGGEKSMTQAMKVATYSMTAAWLAGVVMILPALGFLSIAGLYSLYLLYLGLPALMKAPAEKATAYTVVVIIAAVILWVVVGAVVSIVVPSPQFGVPMR